MLVFLIVGLGVALWQAKVASAARSRAEDALRQSQDVSEFLVGLFQASDPEAAFGDTVAARELLRRGVAEVERLEGQPVIQARLLVTLGRVYENLARYPDAERLYQRALDQRRAALGPQDIEVAENLERLGTLYRRMGRYRDADSLYRVALQMKTALLGPNDPAVAQTLYLLSFLMPYLSRMEASETLYKAGPGDSARCQPAGSPAYRDDDPARHYSDAAGQTRRGRTLPASSARLAPRVGWGGRNHHGRSKGLPGRFPQRRTRRPRRC